MACPSSPAPAGTSRASSSSKCQIEELEAILPPQTQESRADSSSQKRLSKDEEGGRTQPDTVPQAAVRFFSRRSLARALRDVGFAVFPLYFLVFAIMTHVQNGEPIRDFMGGNLLAMAKYVRRSISGAQRQSICATSGGELDGRR